MREKLSKTGLECIWQDPKGEWRGLEMQKKKKVKMQ
jgi:hypothetical protein